MKHIKHILACIALSLSLSGCSFFDFINPGHTIESSTLDTEHPADTTPQGGDIHHGGSWDYDSNEHWKICDECGERYAIGVHDFVAEREDGVVNYSCWCGYSYEGVEPTSLESLTINSDNFYNYGNYDTGNYGSKAVASWNFEYYRIYTSYGYCFAIKPNFSEGDGTLPGAFLNTSSRGKIWSISITYAIDGFFQLSFGNTAERTRTFDVQGTSGEQTITLLTGNSRFFMISTASVALYISSITINYVSDEYVMLENMESNTYNYRISPTTFVGDLVDGESQITVPTSIQVSGNAYTVLSTKTYTYYSFSYALANSDEADDIALTTKEDVANYYLAFHAFPANYATSENKNNVKAIFGSNTRLVQTFDRMDGYALAVPFNGDPPTYHELDIGIPGANYNVSGGRGVGRLVVWDDGFDPYGSDVVAVYTDDHYYTFQEYLNYGSFGDRFNAEGMRTAHGYHAANTLVRG